MKLNFSQIKDVTLGAVRMEEMEDGVHFFRFTAEQEALYKERKESFYVKSFSTSGVQLRFRTNSGTLFLSADVSGGTTRSFFAIDVFADGKKVGVIKNFTEEQLCGDYVKAKFPLGNVSGTFDLGEEEKEVRICFPWSVIAVLKELSLDDGSFVLPVKPSKKMLCFGDSITHGYDAAYPSNKYITKLAWALDAEEHNKAIGGEIFFPALAAAKEDFEPDYITVAYGTNDWSHCTKEEFTKNCKDFYDHLCRNYPDAKVFAITPIWRKDMNQSKPFGDFMSVCETIRETAVEHDNVFVIEGHGFVPGDEALFSDLRLHPNDKGFAYYAENLIKRVKETL